MIGAVKSNPKTIDEYRAFESLLRRVVQADPHEVRADLDAEQRQRAAERAAHGEHKRGRTPRKTA